MNKKIIVTLLISAVLIIGMSTVSAKLSCSDYKYNTYSDSDSYSNYDSYNDYNDYPGDYGLTDDYAQDNSSSYNQLNNNNKYNVNNKSLASNNNNNIKNINISVMGQKSKMTFTVMQVQVLNTKDTNYSQYYCKVITTNGTVIYFNYDDFKKCHELKCGDIITVDVEQDIVNINENVYNVIDIKCC